MASKNEYLKFSFYGRTAVGKTSMLAALDMQRVGEGNKGGKILPLENVKPPQDPEDDSEAAQLLRGHAAVAAAVEELKKNGKPLATAVDVKVMQIRCEFPSSKQNGGHHKVVLYEYAGEILDPTELNNEGSLIQDLHRILEDCDAFLVVVETPISREKLADFNDDMHKLRKAFSAIRGKKSGQGKLHIPVLMLITKWDRYEPSLDSKTQDERLEQFFTDYPTFKNVRDDLASGINEDMFKVFPVSALGKVEDDGTKNPTCKLVGGAPQSYGLEQPFIWAAEKVKEGRRAKAKRRSRIAAVSIACVIATLIGIFLVGDALQWNRAYSMAISKAKSPTGNSQDYTNLLTSYASSSLPKNLFLRMYGYSKAAARNERDAFERKGQEEAWAAIQAEPDPLTKVALAIKYKIKWENGIYIDAVDRIIDTVDVEQDKTKIQQVKKRCEERIDEATEQELNSLKAEVGNTKNSLKNPKMFEAELDLLMSMIDERIRQRQYAIDKAKVEQLANKIEGRLDAASILDLESLKTEVISLKESLNDSGSWEARLTEQANRIEEIIGQRKLEADNAKVEELTKIVIEALKLTSVTDLKRFLDDIEKLELFDPDRLSATLDSLTHKINDRIIEIISDIEREKFKIQVVNELDAKNYLDAGDLLDSRLKNETDHGWLGPLTNRFLEQLPEGYKGKLADYTLNKRWQDGDDYLETLKTRMTSWHADIKSEGIRTSISASKTEFDIAHDKYLYQQVRESPTTINIDRYLEKSPLRTMANEVRDFQIWVVKTSTGDQEYTFTLTGFVWDQKAYPRNNWVQVWYGDDEKLLIDIEKVLSVSGESTTISSTANRKFTWNPQKKDRVKIRINVKGDGYFDFVHGNGSGEFKLDSGAKQLELPSPDGYGTQKANFTIEPVFPKPSLPLWSNR